MRFALHASLQPVVFSTPICMKDFFPNLLQTSFISRLILYFNGVLLEKRIILQLLYYPSCKPSGF
jgi:hypothetical protein